LVAPVAGDGDGAVIGARGKTCGACRDGKRGRTRAAARRDGKPAGRRGSGSCRPGKGAPPLLERARVWEGGVAPASPLKVSEAGLRRWWEQVALPSGSRSPPWGCLFAPGAVMGDRLVVSAYRKSGGIDGGHEGGITASRLTGRDREAHAGAVVSATRPSS